MSKIKGWKKESESSYFIKYRHTSTYLELNLRKEPVGTDWIVWSWKTSGKRFNTKQKALDYAVKYMRSHPNG